MRAAHTKIPRLNRRQVRIIIACLNTLSCFSEEISIANILFLIEQVKAMAELKGSKTKKNLMGRNSRR